MKEETQDVLLGLLGIAVMAAIIWLDMLSPWASE